MSWRSPCRNRSRGRWAGRVLLDWGKIPASYGWVFPKGDRLTVGVIAARGPGRGHQGVPARVRRPAGPGRLRGGPGLRSPHPLPDRRLAAAPGPGDRGRATPPGCSTRGPARASASRSAPARWPASTPPRRGGTRTAKSAGGYRRRQRDPGARHARGPGPAVGVHPARRDLPPGPVHRQGLERLREDVPQRDLPVRAGQPAPRPGAWPASDAEAGCSAGGRGTAEGGGGRHRVHAGGRGAGPVRDRGGLRGGRAGARDGQLLRQVGDLPGGRRSRRPHARASGSRW